jgi:hypothetical protein
MPPGQAKKVAHVHVSGCGHVLVDGAWISVSSVPGPKQGKGRGN